MDPSQLAQAATTLLAPYLIQAGEKLAEEAIKKLPAQVGKLWNAISAKLSGKPAAQASLQEMIEKADDPDNQEAFSIQLKKVLKDDPDFLNELTSLFKAAKDAGGINNVGNGSIAIGGVAAGAGGIAIGGSVGGSVVIGNSNTISGQAKPEGS
jgi:hypothetical protein